MSKKQTTFSRSLNAAFLQAKADAELVWNFVRPDVEETGEHESQAVLMTCNGRPFINKNEVTLIEIKHAKLKSQLVRSVASLASNDQFPGPLGLVKVDHGHCIFLYVDGQMNVNNQWPGAITEIVQHCKLRFESLREKFVILPLANTPPTMRFDIVLNAMKDICKDEKPVTGRPCLTVFLNLADFDNVAYCADWGEVLSQVMNHYDLAFIATSSKNLEKMIDPWLPVCDNVVNILFLLQSVLNTPLKLYTITHTGRGKTKN